MTLPLQLQTIYQDLVQHHEAEPKVSIEGSIMSREKSGKKYWVARKRLGDKVAETAIGPDNPETRSQVEAAREEQAAHVSWVRTVSANVKALRAGRCLAPDLQSGKLLAAIAKTGFFDGGGILGGTQAFRHFPVMIGMEAPGVSFSATADIDLLAGNGLRLIGPDESFTQRLKDQGVKLEPVQSMDDKFPMKWRVDGGIELEILSTVGRGGETSRKHVGLNEGVQALKFLEFSLEEPVKAVSLYRSGVKIQVPAPARYAMHKLLVAQLRSGTYAGKRQKDLKQAEWLVESLSETHPFELLEAWEALQEKGPRWRDLAQRSLHESPAIQKTLDDLAEMYGSKP